MTVGSHHVCQDCGSSNIRWDMGTCTPCGESMNGEGQPASRTEGFFHRRRWNEIERERDQDKASVVRRLGYVT